MVKHFGIALIICFYFSLSVSAQTPTWSVDIAPILYNNCTSCHHSGGLAPFSLITYDEAKNNAVSMKAATQNKIMPPWPPAADYGSFAHERVLTPQQIQALKDWADNNTPQGDVSKAPAPPSYTGNTVIANPDLEVTIPSYTLISNEDEYRCFPIPSNLVSNRYITGIEVIPGNSEVVHHVLVFQDKTNTPANLDQADPEPGYVNFGGTGSSSSKLIGAWVPGMQPAFYPPGMGVRIPANTNIVLQVHYPAGKKGKTDQTKVRFKLGSGSFREVFIDPELYHTAPVLQNGPLYIPANQTKTFIEKYTVPVDASILNIGPHMHLIGKTIKVYGILPNKDTLKLIKIDDWDFHWQGFYPFKNIIKLPAGTVLTAEAFYDNTSNNPDNPSSPPQAVSLGESTTDEMMLVYFSYMIYQKGDENINLDTMFYKTGDHYLVEIDKRTTIQCVPNPVGDFSHLNISSDHDDKVTVMIFGMDGKTIAPVNIYNQLLSPGTNSINVNTDLLPKGNYIVRVKGLYTDLTTQLVKE